MSTQSNTQSDERLVAIHYTARDAATARARAREDFLTRASKLEERGGGWVVSRSAVDRWYGR